MWVYFVTSCTNHVHCDTYFSCFFFSPGNNSPLRCLLLSQVSAFFQPGHHRVRKLVAVAVASHEASLLVVVVVAPGPPP